MIDNSLTQPVRPAALHPWFFLRWWYGKALLRIIYFGLYVVAAAEDMFSLVVMLKAVITLQPLYQDFSLVGRLIGVVIRLIWIAVGFVLFDIALAVAAAIIAVWFLLPPVLIAGMILSLAI